MIEFRLWILRDLALNPDINHNNDLGPGTLHHRNSVLGPGANHDRDPALDPGTCHNTDPDPQPCVSIIFAPTCTNAQLSSEEGGREASYSSPSNMLFSH